MTNNSNVSTHVFNDLTSSGTPTVNSLNLEISTPLSSPTSLSTLTAYSPSQQWSKSRFINFTSIVPARPAIRHEKVRQEKKKTYVRTRWLINRLSVEPHIQTCSLDDIRSYKDSPLTPSPPFAARQPLPYIFLHQFAKRRECSIARRFNWVCRALQRECILFRSCGTNFFFSSIRFGLLIYLLRGMMQLNFSESLVQFM